MSKRKTFEIIQLAAYYEKILSDDQVRMYAEDLEPLTDDESVAACKLYRSDPENQFFPRPISKLVQLIKKPISNQDLSNQLSAELIKAVQYHGRRWPIGAWQAFELDGKVEMMKAFEGLLNGKKQFYLHWEHAAISVFGEQGLKIVQRYGGWERFCEFVDASPDGVIRKQSSDLGLSLLNTKERTGSYNTPLVTGQSSQPSNLIELMKIKTIKE